MAEGIKDTVNPVGDAVVEKTEAVGDKITGTAAKAADWVNEKVHAAACAAKKPFEAGNAAAEVRKHMDVIGSCGNKLGVVDAVEGGQIKLTRKDSPDGHHHFIPLAWVAFIDEHVHLSKDCGDAKKEWTTA